ncbi:LOG family protein, partial [bacterium]|nr:LOG family protein [bacterium]
GGFGTLEELSEMIVQKQLGYNKKPIVLLNTKGYYNNLIKFFDDIFEQKFAHKDGKQLYFLADTPQDAIEYINNYIPEDINYLRDKIKINR